MKEFLEKTLRQNVIMTENKEVYKKLPLAYRGRYDIFTVETNGVLWMAIHPKDDVGLVMLRRDRAGVEKMTGLNCAIFLDRTTFYIKEKMMEEGIPFVIEGKQVFLPFIGYLLSKENERELAPVHLISFLTQKMLLMAIYERWNEVKVSDAAKRIGVSTKSASRCFDELEYLNIDVLGMKGKSRVINIPDDRKQLWQQIERVLRNPVINLFETHTHSPVCDNSVSENDMKNFLNELFSAISIMDMSHSRYLKPKNIDENKELEYITLEKNVRNAAYKIDEAYLYNLQTGTIPAKLKEDLANIEIKLTNVLTEYYAKYTHEELNDLSLLELLMLVRECMIEHS